MAIDPIENEFTQTAPVIDADEDTWGTKHNNGWSQIRGMFDAVVTAVNALITLAEGALQRSGGTMTGEIKLGDPSTVAGDAAGYRGAPVVEFNANKTLALTDAGKAQCLTGSNARDLTIPPVGTVGFPVGTIIPVYADNAALGVKRGSGVTLKLAGTSTNKDCTVAAGGFGSLFHRSTNVWVLSGTGVA